MMTKNAGFISLCVLLALCVSSCSSRKTGNLIAYPRPGTNGIQHLTPETLAAPNDLAGAYGLNYLDDNHLLLQLGRDTFFGVWNIAERRMEEYFLRRGRGPGEAISVGVPRIRHADNGSIMLDINSNLGILHVDYDALMSGQDYLSGITQSEEILKEGFLFKYFPLPNDLAACLVEEDLDYFSFKIIDLHNKHILNTFTMYPYFRDPLSQYDFNHYATLGQNGERLAMLFRNYNRILIFDLQANTSLCISSGRKQEGNYETGEGTARYLYAVYVKRNGMQMIQVFDWGGKLVRTYQTDQYLVSIAVDPQDQYLYGLSSNEELVRFRL